jgi:hypothetical protein
MEEVKQGLKKVEEIEQELEEVKEVEEVEQGLKNIKEVEARINGDIKTDGERVRRERRVIAIQRQQQKKSERRGQERMQ